jgi:hypothetical protein
MTELPHQKTNADPPRPIAHPESLEREIEYELSSPYEPRMPMGQPRRARKAP